MCRATGYGRLWSLNQYHLRSRTLLSHPICGRLKTSFIIGSSICHNLQKRWETFPRSAARNDTKPLEQRKVLVSSFWRAAQCFKKLVSHLWTDNHAYPQHFNTFKIKTTCSFTDMTSFSSNKIVGRNLAVRRLQPSLFPRPHLKYLPSIC